MQDMREIPAIVTEKIVISVQIFTLLVGVPPLAMSLANRRTDRFACLEQFFILDR